jgi:aspartyl-tRNA(Asn)/glutamyl-tRNA(Gln) amidotransferase subunit A
MPETELLYMPATKAAAMIRRKVISPVEYVDAVLAAIERAQPRLNAFVTITADAARREARAAEAAVMSGAALGPLHGVAVNVKDQLNTEGVLTAHGSAIHAGNIPAKDDICVARLRAAGAIVVGKSTLPEFGHKGLTDSPAYGITRNPWTPGRPPGGSSGGAAAAVAAGLTPLGLGSDGAGSIRIPAACCGIVGHKPTLGAVPWENAIDGFSNYTYAGPLTRTVTDAALMHTILSGPSPQDPWSLRGQDQGRLAPTLIGEDLSALRVGHIARTANPRVDRDVEANTRRSLEALAGLGAAVEEVTDEIDWIEFPGRIMYQGNFFVACSPHLPEWHNKMDPVLLAFMERGSKFSLTEFRQAQYARTRLFRTIQKLLERYDVLVTPTLTRSALPVEFDAAHDEVEVAGERCGITRQGWTSYVYPFNLTGHPALTVPSGFAADGLPTGVQLVGRWGADLDVLRLGAVLERVRPWADRRPAPQAP